MPLITSQIKIIQRNLTVKPIQKRYKIELMPFPLEDGLGYVDYLTEKLK